jgi:hypothetical protein
MHDPRSRVLSSRSASLARGAAGFDLQSARCVGAQSRALGRTFVCLLTLLLIGCAHAPKLTAIPSELTAASERYPVLGRVQPPARKVSFGPYQTSRTALGEPSGTQQDPTMFNGQLERTTRHQTGWFELATPSGAKISAGCIQDADSQLQHDKQLALSSDGVRIASKVVFEQHELTYRCTIRPPKSRPMRLELIHGGKARVRAAGRDITLARIGPHNTGIDPGRVNRNESIVVFDGGSQVAAVDLTPNKESVLLRRDLPQDRKDEFAAICMALLLRRDLR